MKSFAVLSVIASIAALTSAASVQVNFYSDTGCRNFIGSRFIDYDTTKGGQYSSGGPSGSRGGEFIDSNNLGLAFRGFTNNADGSQPFTSNVSDGDCIGSEAPLFATFDV